MGQACHVLFPARRQRRERRVGHGRRGTLGSGRQALGSSPATALNGRTKVLRHARMHMTMQPFAGRFAIS